MYEKWRPLQKSRECHVTMVAQLWLCLVLYKITMCVQDLGAMVKMKVNLVS